MTRMIFVSTFILMISILTPMAMAGSVNDFDDEWPNAGVSAMASGARHACWGMHEGFEAGKTLERWLTRLENADVEALRLALNEKDEEIIHE